MKYPPVRANRDIYITKLHSLYYFQYTQDDKLEGESHDFWELVYMDAGEALIQSGEEKHLLYQGEVIIHSPNQYHCIHLQSSNNPIIMIVSFSVQNKCLQQIANRPLILDKRIRVLLSHLLEEGLSLYGPLLDCHRDLSHDRLKNARFGALQMIVDYLELILIHLLRNSQMKDTIPADDVLITYEEHPEVVIEQLKDYMRSHLSDNLKFPDFCKYLNISGTTLKKLVRTHSKDTVMHSYQILRIHESCRMLRSGRWNIGEVAIEMGYSSPQAFSTQFRRIMGISPTEYIRRVAAEPKLIKRRSK